MTTHGGGWPRATQDGARARTGHDEGASDEGDGASFFIVGWFGQTSARFLEGTNAGCKWKCPKAPVGRARENARWTIVFLPFYL